MAVKFTFYGGMTVRMEREDGYVIVADPYFTGNPYVKEVTPDMYDVDAILVTHIAYDHFGDSIEILKRGRAIICGGREVIRAVLDAGIDPSKCRQTGWGDRVTLGETSTVHTVLAHHGSVSFADGHAAWWPPFGFVVEVEPHVTYYHMGDTSIYGDMKMLRELYRPNVMTACISRMAADGGYEMTPYEAATATKWVEPDVVIPCHLLPDEVGLGHLEEYRRIAAAMCPGTAVIDQPGTTFVYRPFCVEV